MSESKSVVKSVSFWYKLCHGHVQQGPQPASGSKDRFGLHNFEDVPGTPNNQLLMDVW